jgi:hypothetical protein
VASVGRKEVGSMSISVILLLLALALYLLSSDDHSSPVRW